MSRPVLSIVIANYNYGRYLHAAIESVYEQNVGDAVELIICDGASVDNSLEIIKKYAGGLPPNLRRDEWITGREGCDRNHSLISWWCSEVDGGQSAAFNKGFLQARGEWLTWLNADELYTPRALQSVLSHIKKFPAAQWITANDCLFDDESGVIKKVNWGPHYQFPIFKGNRAIAAVFGPSSFFKKELLLAVGGIDERLHYSMDSCLWASFYMLGVTQTRLNKICWKCRIQKSSKTFGEKTAQTMMRRHEEEIYWREKIGYTYLPTKMNLWYWVWMFGRLLDFSIAIRFYKKIKYEGKRLTDVDL